MLRRNRLYTKKEPDKDAIVYYIFCEGKRTEPQYFLYFAEMDSKIKFEIIGAEQHDRNTPDGLYEKACTFFNKTDENPNPKYELADIDKVWFVIDTDEWKGKIKALRSKCKHYSNWFIAQSNPSFEIWLYYHFHDRKPEIEEVKKINGFKAFVNQKIKGGFDSREHPKYIQTAVANSERNFEHEDNEPKQFSTNLHELAKQIIPLIKEALDAIIANSL